MIKFFLHLFGYFLFSSVFIIVPLIWILMAKFIKEAYFVNTFFKTFFARNCIIYISVTIVDFMNFGGMRRNDY